LVVVGISLSRFTFFASVPLQAALMALGSHNAAGVRENDVAGHSAGALSVRVYAPSNGLRNPAHAARNSL